MLQILEQRKKDFKSFNYAMTYFYDNISQELLELSEIETNVNRKIEILENDKTVIEILQGVKRIDLLDLKRMF